MKPRGFTLIELLVVIAIIGLLATLSVISFSNAAVKTRDTQRHHDLNALQKALELYYDQYGSYPSSAGAWRGMTATYGSYGTTGATGYIPNLAPTFINKLPADPRPMAHPELNAACVLNESSYVYRSNGSGYKLLAHCDIEAGSISTSDPMRDSSRSYALGVCDPFGIGCSW